jgi:hypothetical protein
MAVTLRRGNSSGTAPALRDSGASPAGGISTLERVNDGIKRFVLAHQRDVSMQHLYANQIK